MIGNTSAVEYANALSVLAAAQGSRTSAGYDFAGLRPLFAFIYTVPGESGSHAVPQSKMFAVGN
jgi:hypothetical protein